MAKAPVFQHRHYKAIAALIADMHSHDPGIAGYVAKLFSGSLAADNDRFNRDRFLAACKGQPINGRDKVRS